RAISREAAMRMNVINEYTYTLETIIQAGHSRTAITSVPVRTNPETRKSRLFHSMFGYIKRSGVTIIRAFMMYKPLKFFGIIGVILLLMGLGLGVRFLIYLFLDEGTGHVQSLILAAILMIMGFQSVLIGLQADIIAANRKLLEDIQYHVRKLDYDGNKKE
ncbi:MAG: glycosyltransferase family 2 protein, partial [Lachnospiraceae bacterium]|nr:glycosyltransferase family 2 protein [Lachnospiraceae bacterium]